MESKIYLEKYKYWNEIVHGHDLLKNTSFPFYEKLEKNEEFHESMGLKYIGDLHETNGLKATRVEYMFKIVDKHKYMLAKIQYGF